METKVHNKVVKKLELKMFNMQDELYKLIASNKFYRRENNLLRAKLIQWEKGRTDKGTLRCNRSYANLRVRSVIKKNPDKTWNKGVVVQ